VVIGPRVSLRSAFWVLGWGDIYRWLEWVFFSRGLGLCRALAELEV